MSYLLLSQSVNLVEDPWKNGGDSYSNGIIFLDRPFSRILLLYLHRRQMIKKVKRKRKYVYFLTLSDFGALEWSLPPTIFRLSLCDATKVSVVQVLYILSFTSSVQFFYFHFLICIQLLTFHLIFSGKNRDMDMAQRVVLTICSISLKTFQLKRVCGEI